MPVKIKPKGGRGGFRSKPRRTLTQRVPDGLPLTAEEVLAWACTPHEFDEVLGSFEERYEILANARGVARARRWYQVEVVKFVTWQTVRFVGKARGALLLSSGKRK